MRCVVLGSRRRPLSGLARRICTRLLGHNPSAFRCPDTNVWVSFSFDQEKALLYTPSALGMHCRAFGFCYVLVYEGGRHNVSIFLESDGSLVGKAYDSEGMVLEDAYLPTTG